WDLTKGKIAKSDLNGKIAYIDGIDTINDIDVKDFTNIPAHNYEISNRLYITENESFVFYDSGAKAFRIIEKQ
ncbi:MAG: hypothetical protein SPF92_04705, partial [Clostridia bacterium]|nr:hypothetical protein [Clostridia bacterium]MDY5626886.1 hypothetical protein [Clostridia bacterium]